MKRMMNHLWPLLIALVCASTHAAEGTHPIAETTNATASLKVASSSQGKAVARKGAIELTLLVHSKKFSAKNEKLWYLIRVRNISNAKIRLTDETLIQTAVDDLEFRNPLRIEITDTAGNAPKPLLGLSGAELGAPGAAPFPNPIERKAASQPKQKKVPEKWLNPGDYAETPMWADPEPLYPRNVIAGFKEFSGHASFMPGNYKIRAVYDHALSEVVAKAGVVARPEDVKLVTPYIKIVVAP